MKKKGSSALLNTLTISERVVKELAKAGLGDAQIAEALNISIIEVKKYTKNIERPKDPNMRLANQILYDANMPIASSQIIENEKERFKEYCNLEAKCIKLMEKLLDYYMDAPPGDLAVDRLRATLAKDFISATHHVREELIAKYGIDKAAEAGDSKIKIEFIAKENK